MNLGKRMSMNASMVPNGSRVADIGCDHGKLSVYLVEKGIATEAVASDVAEGPLRRAQETVKQAGLGDKIHIRLGYGAETIGLDADGRPEVDTAVMAGIGGMLALDIVKRSIDLFRALDCFIIQAQSNLDTMREELDAMDFVITDEEMAFEDGKFYTAIKYVPAEKCEAANAYGDAGEDMTHVSYCYTRHDDFVHSETVRGGSLDEADLLYGPILRRKAPVVFKTYLTREQSVCSGILANLEGTDNGAKIKEIRGRLEIIAKILDGRDDR